MEAWERRHDYDLYCVLARQFWPLDAEPFRECTRPGKKLYLEIEAPARVIMRMWKTCWPFRKVTTARACAWSLLFVPAGLLTRRMMQRDKR